jgi:CDP-diacylglycerol--serine O-phosphatidyltransferase
MSAMHRIRTVAVFPTMFTLGNLVCGFFSIVVAARIDRPLAPDLPPTTSIRQADQLFPHLDPEDPWHNVMLSGGLIFLAMVFDALDGHVARLSRVTSDFGAQLDSLCDLVTFGVAPGFLLVKMCPGFTYRHREAVWMIAAAFAACAALRLARFNVETDEEDDHSTFSGLPSPAAAGAIAGFGLLFYELQRDGSGVLVRKEVGEIVSTLLPYYAVLVALLMVSRIPYPHVVNQVFRGQRSFGHVVGLLFAMVAVMLVKGYAVPLIGFAFVLSGPVRYLWLRLYRRREQAESLF